MNYDNVAPEGKSLLQYLLSSADTELWHRREDEGEGQASLVDVNVLYTLVPNYPLTPRCFFRIWWLWSFAHDNLMT